MTDPEPEFGAGFVAASEVTSRFARDVGAATSNDDRMDDIQQQLDEQARQAAEASDGSFFDDFGAIAGHDGGLGLETARDVADPDTADDGSSGDYLVSVTDDDDFDLFQA
jgi:hypothetical protein